MFSSDSPKNNMSEILKAIISQKKVPFLELWADKSLILY